MLELRYNLKSHSPQIARANNLAQQLNGIIDQTDHKTMIVKVDAQNSRLSKLLELVKGFKGTALILDGDQIDDLNLYYWVIGCKKKTFCQGHCEHMGNYWHNILDTMGIKVTGEILELPIDEDMFNTDEFPGIITEATAEKFTVDRNELLRSYDKYFSLHQRLCPSFSKEVYSEQLKALPEIIEISRKDRIRLQEQRNKDLESAAEQKIDEIITRMGLEIETRLRKVLDEYFPKR